MCIVWFKQESLPLVTVFCLMALLDLFGRGTGGEIAAVLSPGCVTSGTTGIGVEYG
jgi:hypothetical protein